MDVERWQNTMAAHPETRNDLEQAEPKWFALYQRLYGTFGKTYKLIAAMEKIGHTVDGKDDFIAAWRELRGIVVISPESVAAGAQQIKCGQVKSLAEVTRELWDQHIDGGSAQTGISSSPG